MNRRSVFNFRLPPGLLPAGSLRGDKAGGIVKILAALCALLLHPMTIHSAPAERNPLSTKIAAVIRALSGEKSSAVVRIRSFDEHGEVAGTGFYIDPTGTICTLSELVLGSRDIMIEEQGKTFPAALVASDARSGVAFLKAVSPKGSVSFLPPLPITNAPQLTPVLGIGYPREKQAATVLGMITGSTNHDGDNYFCVTHLMASLPLSEGEGGSPVLDLSGNLIGIVSTGNTQLGICTVLPSAAIEKLHHDLLRFGGPNPGWVGAVVEIAAVPEQNSQTRVVSVEPGSPAETAGIRPGDTLLALGKHPIHTPEDVLDASFYLTAGEAVNLRLARDGVIKKITLQCSERPAPPGNISSGYSSNSPTLLGESAR